MRNTSTSPNRPTQKTKAKTVGSYIKGLPLIFFCLVTLLALSGVSYGKFNQLLASTLRWFVGSGSYLLALLIGVQGWFILRGRSLRTYVSWGQLLTLELIMLCVLGLWTLQNNETLALYPSTLKSSGGLLGWTMAFFVSLFGATVGKILLSLCILLLLPPLFKWPLKRMQNVLANQEQKVNAWQTALQLPAPTNQATSTRSNPTRQAEPSSHASPRRENRAKRASTSSSTRLPTNQPVQRNVRATSTSPVSRAKSLDPSSAQSPYRPASTATRPLPNWVTDEVMPPIPQKDNAEPILPAQAVNRRDEASTPLKPSVSRSHTPKPPKTARSVATSQTVARRDDASTPLKPSVSRSHTPQPPKTARSVATSQTVARRDDASTPLKPSASRSRTPQPSNTTPAVTTKKEALPVQKPVTQPIKSQKTPATPPKKKPKVKPPEHTVPPVTDIDPPMPRVRKINTIVPVSAANTRKRDDLPPFDILQQHSGKVDPLEAQEKARLIEETLEHFGVPAAVVEINQGPRITQFGVEPGFIETFQRDGSVKRRKVKVNAIKALSDDLALALAARSIRIQSRVPGRTYVGIELPNDEFETVTLHSVLTSQAYQKIKGDLVIALGRDVTGQPVAADISRMPHMLIAGATGSGKSVCINAIIASLLFNLGPEQLKLLLIDPKMVELVPYNGIPHLHMPVITDMEKVVGSLSWAVGEMERRYNLFSQARKRNLQSYNKWAKSNGQDVLPYVVIIIDELADLMMAAADEVEQIICRLAQMARATGMHLILATQRPSVDVVTGLIKANIPTRVSFAVASGTDSRVILDSTGAEDLLGLGDMLYQASDASRLQRIQGCYVSDDELQELVDYWLHAKAKKALTQILQEKPAPKARLPQQKAPKAASQDTMPKDDDLDKLLNKAIALVEEHQSISISMLQRKLRISYTRAARMIKELKRQGVIGPGKR